MQMQQNLSILIVDDNPEFHRDVWFALRTFCALSKALDTREMRQKLASPEHFDLVLLDLQLDKNKNEPIGLKLISEIRKTRKGIPIIVVTEVFNEKQHVLEAIRHGASAFIDKNDMTPESLVATIKKVTTQQSEDPEPPENIPPAPKGPDLPPPLPKVVYDNSDTHPFIGSSPRILEVKRILSRLALLPKSTILITGETGTGKEVAARFIHRNSPRSGKPFVGVDLSATTETLIESHLFGHVKGAFSGADKDNDGIFKQADGGVLLLDEIGDINQQVQIKLLRVIEERIVRPQGAQRDYPVDVHLLTATNRKLADLVSKGQFRNDLFQRLKTITIELPPLRDRLEDLPLLLQFYLSKQNPGAVVTEVFTREALDRLHQYDWPGNIRELRSTIEHAYSWREIFDKEKADIECLPEEIKQFGSGGTKHVAQPLQNNNTALETPAAPATGQPQDLILKNKKEKEAWQELAEIERTLIYYHGGMKEKVAEHLEYKSADSLRYKIKTYFEKYPHFFEHLPTIRQAYSNVVRLKD